ncbi:MAG: NAD(P)H-hydrate epimerase, partial [Acidobacteria bacterium]|nr:NAD(P)H-hydrate epimerase [Acidobacteriota bacterium]
MRGSLFIMTPVQKVITASEMRELDRRTTAECGIHSLLLMEAAARASVQQLTQHFACGIAGKSVLILCGRGNNGGDGAAVARQLALLGAHVSVALFASVEESQGDARTNFEIIRSLAELDDLSFTTCRTVEEWEQFQASQQDCDVIVDALFGTGLTRPLAGIHAAAVEFIEKQRGCLKVALDLPSGLDADRAEPIGPAVRADVTVTFTAPKPANVLPP